MIKRGSIFLIVILFLALVLFVPNFTFAHPGRTDSSGCHTCRTNCSSWGLSYGEYHCHRSKGVIQPKEPVRSIHNDSGNGVTVSAPEYKTSINITKKVENTNVIDKTVVNIEKRAGLKKYLVGYFNII